MSSFLLDTSYLSALADAARPDHAPALRWYQLQDERDLFTTSVVIGEIARGITRLRPSRRRDRYRNWLRHEVLPVFGARVLPFDVEAALQWGALMGDREREGTIPSNDDAKIAAVAAIHGLTVVTANERDFAAFGVPIVNPLR